MLRFFSLVLILVIFGFHSSSGQVNIDLEKMFKSHEVLRVDSRDVYQQILSKRNGGHFVLKLSDNIKWDLTLENAGIISDDYFVTEANATGLKNYKPNVAIPMKGHLTNNPNSKVSLTFNEGFIYGFIQIGSVEYFIEPMTHYKSTANPDDFIVYSSNDVITDDNKKCGYEIYKAKLDERKVDRVKDVQGGNRLPGQCLRVEIALAADFSMVQQYGSSAAVQNHNIGVLNNVQTNYDDEFPDELLFILTQQWVSTCATCDPWTSSNDPYQLLDDFTAWGISGFTAPHAVASLWSSRSFSGSVIGLAWVGAVCTQNKYNVLEDFTTNAQQKRVLQAHEIGHNFDATHTSGIMAPSVNTSTTWTQTNINEIENYYNSVNCLTTCPSTNQPTANFTYLMTQPCEPAQVQFTNTSTNATSYLWTFEGGTPATSTLQNPIVTFDVAGTYNVTLQAFGGSNSNTVTLPIFVNAISDPVASFSYTISGQNVSFIYTGSGAANYYWEFGNGNTSTSQNPTQNYPLNGIYNVTLDVINACGENSITQQVEISVLPFVNFTSNISTGCQPQTITFSNLSTNATSYLWTFPGGTPATSTSMSPTVVYSTPGVYDVTLEATNNTGTNTIVKNNFITINPNPVAGFTTVVSGATVNFTNTSQHGNTYNWAFGDGNTSTAASPTHIYNASGTYTVTLTTTNNCGSNTSSQAVNVTLAPTAAFNSDTTIVCASGNIQFNSQASSSTTTWLWTFEGGSPATSTLPNPLVQYAVPGIYDATLTVSNASGQNTLTLTDYVTVLGLPTATFASSQTNNVVNLTNTGNGATSTSWQIIHGEDIFVGGGNNIEYTASANGTFQVVMTNQNQCGQMVSDTAQFTINVFPIASFNINGGSAACASQPVTYAATGSNYTYQWAFAGAQPSTSTDQNPTVYYALPGSYTVQLISSNAFGNDTLNTSVLIGDVPNAVFSSLVANNQVQFTNNTTNANSYVWQFGDGNTSTIQNPTHTYTTGGTYTVKLIATNNCGMDTSINTVLIVLSSTSEALKGLGLEVYPNPASDKVFVRINANETIHIHLDIIDMAGNILQKNKHSILGETIIPIETETYSSGLYLLRLTTEAGSAVYKLIISK